MRVFVTGGAGYIGSIVAERLVQEQHEVVVFDNLSTGHRAAVPSECQFVNGDLRDVQALRAALDSRTDAVLHFAARSLVPESMRDPMSYWAHNISSSVTLVRVLQEKNIERIVFSSTAAVYGAPDLERIDETATCNPTHAYGGSKRAIEMILEDARRAWGLRCVFLRYFNAAGASGNRGEAHDPETHLIPNLLQAILEDRGAARIFGDDYPTPDGTCVRDYVHVLDLADAHLRALEALDGGICGPVNLGGGGGCSVLEVVEAVRRITGHPLPVRMEPRRPGDPPRLVADIERARQLLGWQPGHSTLDAVIGSAWKWLQTHPHGYGGGGESCRNSNA